jgi:hypothetical protein
MDLRGFGQILVDHSCTRRVLVPIASPRHTRAGPVSEHACVFLSFFSPSHSCKCIKITHYLSRLPSTSNVGLKSYHPLCMNVPLRFIRNSIWVRPNNSNNSCSYVLFLLSLVVIVQALMCRWCCLLLPLLFARNWLLLHSVVGERGGGWRESTAGWEPWRP